MIKIILLGILLFLNLAISFSQNNNLTGVIKTDSTITNFTIHHVTYNDYIHEFISNEVKKEIDNKLTSYLTILSIIITIFIALSAVALRLFVQDQVVKEYNKVQKEYESKQIEILSSLDLNAALTLLQSDFTITETTIVQNKNKILKYLEDKMFDTKSIDEKITLVNWIISVFYKLRLYDEVLNIVKEYEKENIISSVSWANTAIIFMNKYEYDQDEIYKIKFYSSCSKSLDITPDYGEIYAFQIIIKMVDFVKGTDIEIKEIIKKEIIEILTKVLGKPQITSRECFGYLEGSRGTIFEKYVIQLEEILPESITKLKGRSI